MRRQASAQATVQEVSGAKASAREATGRAYACTEHVPQRSPLGGLVRENDGVAHDVVSRGRHFAPNWRPFGVQQRLTPRSTKKKGCPEPAPLGGVGGEQWRAHSGLRSPPDGQKIGLWGSLNLTKCRVSFAADSFAADFCAAAATPPPPLFSPPPRSQPPAWRQ